MENRKFNTRSIVEAGLLSAIIVVLMLMTMYVPILDMLGVFILPVPITLLYMRHDLKVTLTGLAASALIIAAVLSPVKAIVMTVMFGLSGIGLGYCFKKDKSTLVTIAVLTVASLLGMLVNIGFTAALIDKTTISESLIKTFRVMNEANVEAVNMMKQTYTSMGAPEEVMKQIDQISKALTVNLTLGTISLILVGASVISAFLDYIVSKSILRKMGYNIRKMKAFTELYITSLAGALIVMPMAAGMLMYGKKIPGGEAVLLGGRTLMQTVFMVIGISVVFYFLKNRFRLSTGVRVLIGFLTIPNPTFGMIYLYIGLTDMILDFRKINPNRVLRK